SSNPGGKNVTGRGAYCRSRSSVREGVLPRRWYTGVDEFLCKLRDYPEVEAPSRRLDRLNQQLPNGSVIVDLVAELAEGVAHCQAQGDYLVVIPDEGCIKCAHNINQGFAP